MRKSWIAFAAAAACTLGAQAQSSVQLSGLADVYAGSIRMAGDASRRTGLGDSGMTTSWLGLTGAEDLGGGLKVDFAFTSFFNLSNGRQGRFPGDTFWSRDANIGLSGNFGSVKLGRWLAPNFLPSIIGNPLGDSFTFAPLILHMDVPLFNGSGWGSTIEGDTGWSNQIAYTTPNLGGFKGTVHYQLGNSNAADKGKHNAGASFLYFQGPLTVTGFYERTQLANPVPADLGHTKTNWLLTAAYDFKVVKPYLGYGQSKVKSVGGNAKTFHLGASAPLGGTGSLLASFARTRNTIGGGSATRKTLTVGYDYFMSKRTDLYAMYMNDRITAQTSGSSFAVGIRHRF